MHPLNMLATSGRISPVPLTATLSTKDTRTGIYCIWMPNDPKHRMYVGQSGRSVPGRVLAHRYALRRAGHPSAHLQRAYTKYGEAAFCWALVDGIPADVQALTAAEQSWMEIAGRDRLFNSAPAAGSLLGHKACGSPDARAKRSAAARKRNAEQTTDQRRAAAQKRLATMTPDKRRAAAAKRAATLTPEKRSAAARKAKASMSAEQRSEAGRKANAALTPEQRSERSAKAMRGRTPEQRKEISRRALLGRTPDTVTKWRESMTPEARRAAALKRSAAMTPEQRSAATRKGHATRRANAAQQGEPK